ncbi:Holliday junction resolvase RuvX [Sphingobacterium sp. FBM7-1]|uniref:Holliday junction resolvase RuvX n=1 Tax=Sphingobacterium sp. FBM7-1 TaxID=2886688 RepID=UPI001D1196C6|nr:Holliday junction resolvase RuvX [Sphingobacterium sp. FBM7-1]MCC2599513.1 Holliday junction resolvase RuvX [Sphingobacterium sp. FBM7-1]
MRIVAFDYGTKRIGIAVTDPMKLIATPLATVHPKDIWTFLDNYIKDEDVETFVVGKPLQMDGTASQSAQHIVGFIRKLKKVYPGIQIIEIDERFTSKIASRVIAESGLKKSKRQEKGLVDSVAATIILQTYMEIKTSM